MSNCHKKYIFAKINLFSRVFSKRNFEFLPKEKITLDSGKKIYCKKIGFFNFKDMHSGYQILMGVSIFWSEVILGSSEASWVCNLKKCWFSTGAQTVWNFYFCCVSDPHYFQLFSGFKWGHFYIAFWSVVIQGYLWGKLMKMRGLVPNQHWPTYFSDLQKKLYLQPHINSKEHYLGGILNFWLKLILYTVSKKVLNL